MATAKKAPPEEAPEQPKQTPAEIVEAAVAEADAEKDAKLTFEVDGHEYTIDRYMITQDADIRRLLRTDQHEEAVYELLGAAQWKLWLGRARDSDPHGVASIEAYVRLLTELNKAAGVGNS